MTSRELLQQRTTLANGDTTWRLSPLVVAALEGRLAVLDGVHRLDMGTLAVLKRQVNWPSRSRTDRFLCESHVDPINIELRQSITLTRRGCCCCSAKCCMHSMTVLGGGL